MIPCAKSSGLDVDKIATCFDPSQVSYSSDPVTAIDLIGNLTKKASPQVKYFPDIRVAGKQHQGSLLSVSGMRWNDEWPLLYDAKKRILTLSPSPPPSSLLSSLFLSPSPSIGQSICAEIQGTKPAACS